MICASILFKIVFTIAWICLFHRRCVGVDQRAGDSLGPVHWFEGVQQQPARERSPRSTHSSGRDLRLQQPCTHPADPYAEHTGGYRGTGKYVESHKWSESNQKKIQSVDFSWGQFGPFKKKEIFASTQFPISQSWQGFMRCFITFWWHSGLCAVSISPHCWLHLFLLLHQNGSFAVTSLQRISGYGLQQRLCAHSFIFSLLLSIRGKLFARYFSEQSMALCHHPVQFWSRLTVVSCWQCPCVMFFRHARFWKGNSTTC